MATTSITSRKSSSCFTCDDEHQHARCSKSSRKTDRHSDVLSMIKRKYARVAKTNSTCTVNVVMPRSRKETAPPKLSPSPSATHEFFAPAPLTKLTDPFLFFCVH
eukprot:GEMP01142931.1.p1 GENE.GEMP01142931.1~~GEMP01142931.1.p1  ORF type:complete len:113 (+),score=22.83 GEMP01142931.1:25-339(+)